MRTSGLWALCAGLTLLCTAGCGGGGGGASSAGSGTPAVTTRSIGVWTGNLTPASADGTDGTLQVELFQDGNAITGTARALGQIGSAVGKVTGTISGNSITATIQQVAPDSATPAPVTETVPAPLFQFTGATYFYGTKQLIDLNQPVKVVGAGTTYDITTVPPLTLPLPHIKFPYASQFQLADPTIAQALTVTYTPYLTDALPNNQATFTGTINGSSLTGTYTPPASSSATSPSGNFALTRDSSSAAAKRINMTDTWTGAYNLHSVARTLTMKVTQNQDALTFTGDTVPADGNLVTHVTGSGAIIGNQVTFLFTDNGVTVSLTGTVSPDLLNKKGGITGKTFGSTQQTGNFTLRSSAVLAISGG